MATAREALYEEFVLLIENPPGDDVQDIVRKIMNKYRVQTKPGVTTADGLTARDDLGNRLIALWRAGGDDLKQKVGDEIDKFRMQAKQKSAGKKAAPKKAAPRPASAPARPASSTPVAAEAPEADGMPAPPASGDRPPRMEPVAGGPRRRGKTRSECPKCHSKGVVLARSYAGDEYYSCIYCGWQTFKPVDENDPTASLAGRLLGQSSGKH